MRFCGGCGSRLALICADCGASNPLEHRFCGGCGKSLAAPFPPQPSLSAPPPLHSELRQVTAVFCDLVGSTQLSHRLDPETYRQVLAAFRELCVLAVRRMGGEVSRYLGDGLLIAFGWPTAWEDDARRAVRAALAIRDGLPSVKLPEGLPGGLLQVRIGIHTGMVVAGDLSAGDRTEHDALLGETPNIAARIQAEAEPDTILISGSTAALVTPFFLMERIGGRVLRGIEEEVEVVRVLSENAMRDRLAFTAPGAPLFGRAQEISLLIDRWSEAKAGQGDAVLLLGEPGIGKSRVAAEIRRLVAGEPAKMPAQLMTVACSAYDTASPLRPFIEALEHDVGLGSGGLTAATAPAFVDSLSRRGVKQPLHVAAMASLFDAASLFGDEWARLSPDRKRGELFEALSDWILARPAGAPLLIVVEDVHWADESTLALLGHFIGRLNGVAALLLMTARPEFQPPWPSRMRVSQIALRNLGAVEGRRLVENAIGARSLAPEDIDRIIERGGGVPLFIEELVREIAGNRRATDLHIPATLRDLLVARLDRVREARPLLEIAALLGRSFDFSMLAAVAGREEGAVERELNQAVEAEFLEVRGALPLARLSFRHALIQETVHESMLRQRRVELHRRIASAFRTSFPELLERQPEIYAAHCAGGGLVREAVEAWQRAGRRATERSAYGEAASHYRSAVSAVPQLPDEPARDELELGLQVALGAQMIAARGNGAPEVEVAYRRAETLCARVDSAAHRFRAMRGLLTFFMVRGRPAEAQRIGGQLLELAERSADSGTRLQVHRPLGLNLFYLGRFGDALSHLEQALALHDRAAHADHRHEYGSDPAVLALCNRGWIRWFVGDLDPALVDCLEAVKQARQLEHPHSLAFALSFLASVRQCRREINETLDVCSELDELARVNAFPYWATWAQVLGGWAQALSGDAHAGAGAIANGLSAYRSTGAELMVPYFGALLGEALLLDGDSDGARAVINDGLEISHEHEIAFYRPELLRLSARLGSNDGAREAVASSRSLGARTLELRALIELSKVDKAAMPELGRVRRSLAGADRLRDLDEADNLLAG
jgi:class 3 adenylate cyclase/tetratricopeptide (TPR) repeat protein